MKLRYLLDSTTVSSPVSKELFEHHGLDCAIGAPVWQGLICGCQRLTRGKRRISLESYLVDVVHPSFPYFLYDETTAA